MKKMPCLYERDFSNKRHPVLLDAVTPGCEWVLDGEGVATIKRDGTAVMVRGGKLFKRYDAKRGKHPQEGFEPCQEPDAVTGHWPGWIPVATETDGPSGDVWHQLAWWRTMADGSEPELADGTYELCGPMVCRAERMDHHLFIRHGQEVVTVGRTRESIRAWLEANHVEGIVFAHPDGRMCKIRRSDFGFLWPVP